MGSQGLRRFCGRRGGQKVPECHLTPLYTTRKDGWRNRQQPHGLPVEVGMLPFDNAGGPSGRAFWRKKVALAGTSFFYPRSR